MANSTSVFLFVIVSGLLLHTVTGILRKEDCLPSSDIFKIATKFNETSPGEWNPVFTFDKYSKKKTKHIKINFELITSSCEENMERIISGHVIEGQVPTLKPKPTISRRTLQFNQECNKNAKIQKDGKKAISRISSETAMLFTNRPLKGNEKFHIKCSTFCNIGIITMDPLKMTSKCDINSPEASKETTIWIFPYYLQDKGGNHVAYCGSTTTLGNFKYGESKLGVKIGRDKNLHFYYNDKECESTIGKVEKVNQAAYGFIIMKPPRSSAYAEAEIIQNSEMWDD